ncbi:dihydrofolate reductase family protein [Actinocorallia populi]|uniref:dihydrofolate reductase family protein n=1 Tax=Actinocorallia populi TaxID=2079200 RepID=UPI000D08D570|nr:dihydrofolate reductase family protein [Actinocorallia populi]
MRKLVYYVGASIDGFIAGPGGEVDFYPQGEGQEAADYSAWMNEQHPEFVPTHIRAAVGLENAPNKRCDTLVMGLGTYRPALDIGITSPYAHLRQYVVSTSLGEIADPSVELVDGDPLSLVRDLKKEDGLDIWLCGGGRLAGSLLPEVDELIIKSYPVVAGTGIPLFSTGFSPAYFTPTRRRPFDNGVLVTWYSRV